MSAPTVEGVAHRAYRLGFAHGAAVVLIAVVRFGVAMWRYRQ